MLLGRKPKGSCQTVNIFSLNMQECGPRFTLKLRSLQHGTFDTKGGEYEWVHKVIDFWVIFVCYVDLLNFQCTHFSLPLNVSRKWTPAEGGFSCELHQIIQVYLSWHRSNSVEEGWHIMFLTLIYELQFKKKIVISFGQLWICYGDIWVKYEYLSWWIIFLLLWSYILFFKTSCSLSMNFYCIPHFFLSQRDLIAFFNFHSRYHGWTNERERRWMYSAVSWVSDRYTNESERDVESFKLSGFIPLFHEYHMGKERRAWKEKTKR